MLFHFFVVVLWGLGVAVAQGDPEGANITSTARNRVVLDAVTTMIADTRELDEILQQWDGTITGALDIHRQTKHIMRSIAAGTRAAESSRKLGIFGAIRVARATRRLIAETRKVTKDMIFMKDRFKAITMRRLVLNSLVKIQKESDNMNAAVVKKLPLIGRPMGRAMGRRVHKLFQKAIDEYESTNPAPRPPKPKPTKTKKHTKPPGPEMTAPAVGGRWGGGAARRWG